MPKARHGKRRFSKIRKSVFTFFGALTSPASSAACCLPVHCFVADECDYLMLSRVRFGTDRKQDDADDYAVFDKKEPEAAPEANISTFAIFLQHILSNLCESHFRSFAGKTIQRTDAGP